MATWPQAAPDRTCLRPGRKGTTTVSSGGTGSRSWARSWSVARGVSISGKRTTRWGMVRSIGLRKAQVQARHRPAPAGSHQSSKAVKLREMTCRVTVSESAVPHRAHKPSKVPTMALGLPCARQATSTTSVIIRAPVLGSGPLPGPHPLEARFRGGL